MRTFSKIYRGEETDCDLEHLVKIIFESGSNDPALIEVLSHYKLAKPNMFEFYEHSLLNYMGLFYKRSKATTLRDLIMKMYGETLKKKYGTYITPVQANMMSAINEKRIFSFSAPTSSGKSYVIKMLIEKTRTNIAVILPSRALIAEYIAQLREHLDKNIMIMQHVDIINRANKNKRIFVITPERSLDIFSLFEPSEMGLFIFDEAQLTEDGIRGIKFDALVRRINEYFRKAKIVFAHPFIDNPNAQITKNKLDIRESCSSAYNYQAVGKVFIKTREIGSGKYEFNYFSPYTPSLGSYQLEYDFFKKSILEKKSILVYTSKNSITSWSGFMKHKRYLKLLKPSTDNQALEIISEVENYMGKYEGLPNGKSLLVRLMKKGIVYHHGSIPLKLRSLIEKFIRNGFAQVCFATSTLTQGINMPFHVVWLKNFRFNEKTKSMKSLALKNLIGRAGRSTSDDHFNIGVVVIDEKNVSTFSKRLTATSELENQSVLDKDPNELQPYEREYVCAINEDKYVMQYDMPSSIVNRYNTDLIRNSISLLINNILINGNLIDIGSFYKLPKSTRNIIEHSFINIYKTSTEANSQPTPLEISIIHNAFEIFLSRVHNKSLKQIVFWRCERYLKSKQNGKIPFIASAQMLPNHNHKAIPLFKNDKFDYDTLLYDTYDYIDKVWGQCLAPYYIAAFSEYYKFSNNPMAERLVNIFKYGTYNSTDILLQRYGFAWDDLEWIKPCILTISEDTIKFNDKVSLLTNTQLKAIEQFL